MSSDKSKTLLDWLARNYPSAKRTTLRRMAQSGRVLVNGKPEKRANRTLAEDDSVVVRDDAPPAKKPAGKPLPFEMVYEDQDILVVNKPAGLLTSTVPNEKRPTLLGMVREWVEAREPDAQVGLIHRLDRDASGLLIFSKSDDAYASLKRQFYVHSVHREYLAVVHGAPDPAAGKIQTLLVERTDGTVHSTRHNGKGEIAITHYQTMGKPGKRSLIRVVLETGRKHQIRVHLAGRGNPIVGDRVYGPLTPEGHLLLAAVKLTVSHPRDGRTMNFESPLPPYFPKLTA